MVVAVDAAIVVVIVIAGIAVIAMRISTYVMYFVFLFFGVCSLKLSMLQRNAAYCCPNAV